MGSLGRIHDLLGALIQDRVVIGLHANTNNLFRCHVVSTPIQSPTASSNHRRRELSVRRAADASTRATPSANCKTTNTAGVLLPLVLSDRRESRMVMNAPDSVN